MAKIWSVDGNRQWLDGGSMFGNAPRAVWEKWAPPDELGRIELACRALLIDTGKEKVLCETGIGAFFEPKMAERYGVQTPERHRLLENLEAIGVKQEDIDYVILSHLHFDHAGGLLPTFNDIEAGNNDLLFPKAQYVTGKEAFERAKNPHFRDRASFIPGMVEKLEASGRLLIVESESSTELPEGFRFMESHGHTPGQLHTIYQGTKHKVFYAGDLIPGKPWVHIPITMGYDRFPELVIDEKKAVYQKAVPENWWVFFTHDPDDSLCHLSQDEKGRVTPVELQKEARGLEI